MMKRDLLRTPGRSTGTPEVVGAGPSGLAAAITLAKAGREVRVVERHHGVGGRFHGDMQGLENWSSQEDALDRLMALGIEPTFDHKGFDEVTFYDSRLRPNVARTQRPMFYLVRRGPGEGSLDRALLTQTLAAGADVVFGEHRRTASPGTIVATGPEATDGLVSGFTFRTSLPDQAHAIVHPKLSPHGYSYLLIWEGRGTIATSLFGELHLSRVARDATVEAFQTLIPHLELQDRRPFGGYGAVFAPLRFVDAAGRWYVGEAAGLQDAEWGFGMMTAMHSGARAAKSVLQDDDYGAAAHREFEGRRLAGFANRAAFEALPVRVLDVVLDHGAPHDDLVAHLGRHWASTPVKSVVGGLEQRRHAAFNAWRDKSCQSPTCLCLRCSCDHG